MNKARSGYLLLGLAAAAGLVWWLRRSRSAAPDAAAAAGTDATAKALSNGTSFGQVGSNFAENVTPEIVKLTLGYADKIQENAGPCWSRGTADWDNNEKRGLWRWQLSDGSKNVLLNAGTIPTTHRIC